MTAFTHKTQPGQGRYNRQMQLLAVGIWVSMMPLAAICWLICLLNPFLWPYLLWIHYSKVQNRGGGSWRSRRLRNLFLWRHFRDYFPVDLVVEKRLDSSKNYLVCCHPHGILPLGLFANFATDTTNIQEGLQGLTPHLCTLASNFTTPLLREIFLALGMIPVSEESIRYVLSRKESSYVIDVPGGSNESLDQQPGTARLTIKKRGGIFRIALEEGVQLVPVFSFGESNTWLQVDNSRGTLLRTFQEYGKKIAGMSPTLFYGRPFGKDATWGFLPFRTKITTVVGEPLPLRKSAHKDASEQEIDELRNEYIMALKLLYNKHKEDFAPNRKEDLKIVE